MPGHDATDVLRLVERREEVLRRVGPEERRKRDLADSLSVSRSTVDRAVRELLEAGLVDRGEDGYARTLTGRLALEAYDRFVARTESIVAAGDVVGALDSEEAFDAAVLDGAEVVEATRTSPHRPLCGLADLLDGADHAEAFAPSMFPTQVDAWHRRVVEEGMTGRVVVGESAMDRLVSTHRAKVRETIATGRLDVRRATDLPSYGLAVVDADDGPELGVLTHADGGVGGFVRNDAPEAVDWGRSVLARRWADAEPLSLSASGP